MLQPRKHGLLIVGEEVAPVGERWQRAGATFAYASTRLMRWKNDFVDCLRRLWGRRNCYFAACQETTEVGAPMNLWKQKLDVFKLRATYETKSSFWNRVPLSSSIKVAMGASLTKTEGHLELL